MSYQKYGISRELVERVKLKLKNPSTMERVKNTLNGVTKANLQDKATVRKLLNRIAGILNESIGEQQSEAIVRFVIAQKIDPNSTFHLIRLWGIFR